MQGKTANTPIYFVIGFLLSFIKTKSQNDNVFNVTILDIKICS